MLSTEITIERPPEAVWAYFTEPGNWEKWRGGVKAAQWRQGGRIVWALGGSSLIKAITPGKMIRIAGSWMTTTYTFNPLGSGKTVVRIDESSPKGGASFSDGGAAHLKQWKSSLVKLKEVVEGEAKQEVKQEVRQEAKRSVGTAEYVCPHCGSELTGQALITVEVSMKANAVDFQTSCRSCGKPITKKSIEASLKGSNRQSPPERGNVTSPKEKWWKFWE